MQQIIQLIVHCVMLKDDNSIFKNNQDRWGGYPTSQGIWHMQNRATFLLYCEIDILLIAPFLQDRGDFIHGFITVRLHALPVLRFAGHRSDYSRD